ncbi:MAG: hypothetical protein ACPGJV_07655 [Bacteriovoracaceae bacterium]
MKVWSIALLLILGFSTSCGKSSKENEETTSTFYHQFITSHNGVENGKKVVWSGYVPNLYSGQCQVYGNQYTNSSVRFELEIDSEGSFFFVTNDQSEFQGGNENARYGIHGDWERSNGDLILKGFGRSSTDNVVRSNGSALRYSNYDSYALDLPSRDGCMIVRTDQNIEATTLGNNNYYNSYYNNYNISMFGSCSLEFCIEE